MTAMTTARNWVAVLGTAALASCSFSRFDSARDDVVVASFGSPSDGDGFGLVLATGFAGTGPGELMVASRNPATAARFTFTPAGTRNTIKYNSSDQLKAGGGEIGSIAGSTSGHMAIAIGPEGSRQIIFVNPAGELNEAPAAPTPAPGYAVGVALADVFRPATSPASDPSDLDGVVASYNEIFVYPERGVSDQLIRCDTNGKVADGLQSVVAGDVVKANDNTGSPNEIVVGRPKKSGAGSVLITNVGSLANKLEMISNSVLIGGPCPVITEINAPGGEMSFGTKVVLGQVTGSDDLDLIVSAPGENKVFVYPGTPNGPDVANVITVNAPAGFTTPGSFGASIATVDLDGDNKAELAIGEPTATVGGKTNAGRVHVYNVSNGVTTVGDPLAKHSPSDGELFGSSVAGLRVTPSGLSPRDELVVGTHSQVLVYFTTLYAIDMDERTK